MSRGLCRAGLAMALLGLLRMHATAWAAVTLPLEVIGADGTTVSCTVDVPAETSGSGLAADRPPSAGRARGLWMQIHGLSYPNKASVQINSGPWVPLNNETVRVASPGKNYGGIGGAFATLKMVLDLPSGLVVDGPNTLRFRFNGTDGVSIGFRVINLNFLTGTGGRILVREAFTLESPARWRPPYTDARSIAAGEKLWRTAVLTATSFPGAPHLQARCADCHAQDGRDLKYFNFSNLSIIERAKFHGLTPEEGAKIASYIRTLDVPNPGRPWNPPYQPGPRLDAKPPTAWAAGAGIEAVLDRDSDTLRFLFPNGITKEAASTDKTLNLRELPIALQLPDWNHWLPRIHPKDAWEEDFVESPLYAMYAGEGSAKVKRNLRAQLEGRRAQRYIFSGDYSPLDNDLKQWSWERWRFLLPRAEERPHKLWTPLFSEQVYSTAQWQVVKLWELMQEFQLEGYGSTLYGELGEKRTWFSGIPFMVAPHKLKSPETENGIGGDPLTNKYLTNAWYYLQIVLDSGNRSHLKGAPVDWHYVWNNLANLHQRSGAPEGARMTAMLIKAMQQTDNGIGPEDPNRGWQPQEIGDVSRLVVDAWKPMWKAIPANVKTQVMQAVLGAWLDKSREFTPRQYYNGGLADPNYVPSGDFNDALGDRVWHMIPLFRGAGVDGALLGRLTDWAATLWPKADWALLRSPNATRVVPGPRTARRS